MKSKKRKTLNIILHLALALELAVFQFAWPLAIARAAEEISAGETSQNSSAEVEKEQLTGEKKDDSAANITNENNKDKEKTDNTTNSLNEANNSPSKVDSPDNKDKNKDEVSSPENTNGENNLLAAERKASPEDFWKSCHLSEEEENLIKGSEGEKCQQETSCEEIKVCLSVLIEVKNEAKVQNETTSSANTGENSIIIEEKKPGNEQLQEENTEGNNETGTDRAEEQGSISGSSDLQENSDQSQFQEGADQVEGGNNGKNNLDQESKNDGGEKSSDDNSVAKEKLQPENQNTNSAVIETGEATTQANVYNEVNVNIIGENNQKLTENIDGVVTGDINLLEKFNNLLGSGVSESQETGTLVEVNIENNAFVVNRAAAEANTGKNSINGEGESALILTGNAIATANVANIVNLNLIGNNWLFATINIFGEWIGDLIVPGEGLLSVPGTGGSGDISITTDNTVNIENNTEANADTGNDSIKGKNGSASIETGSAQAGSSVKNVVNTTIIKNNWFFLVINNMGSWMGRALHWGGENNVESYSYDFDENEGWESNFSHWFAKIFIKNNAEVENSALASANTGKNSIEGNFGQALVKTGDAEARANVWNFVNTNIIGSNWMLAAVNIFGNWKGNVDFAYPDISLSISDGKEKASSGDSLTYSIVYENKGRADCDEVDLAVTLPPYVSYKGSSEGDASEESGENFFWHLPRLKAGERRVLSLSAVVSNNLPEEGIPGTALAAVKTTTKEVELENNTAADETVFLPLSFGGENSGLEKNLENENQKLDSALFISRKISNKKAKPGEIVKQTIVVKNIGEENLTGVVLQDRLKNKKGEVGTYHWEIGSLKKGQKAIVEYSLQINAWAPSGDYRSKASAFGFDSSGQEVRSAEVSGVFFVEVPNTEEYYNYYQNYQNYPPVQYLENESGLVAAAEAAGNEAPGKVLGRWTNGVCSALPWWGWMAAAIVYFAAIHWALLRQREVVESQKAKDKQL